jgi:hypothetical protein
MNVIIAMAEVGNHVGKEPWPSLDLASWLFDRASFLLIGSLIFGALATVVIVWMGIVKEHHWDLLREHSNEKVASLELETAKANVEVGKANVALAEAQADIAKANVQIAEAKKQTAALEKGTADANARALEAQAQLARFKAPRSIDQSAKAGMIGTLQPFAGQEVALYILGDGPEPNGLAASIIDVLNLSRWKPLSWQWAGAGAATGVIVLYKAGTEVQVAAACDALVTALRSAQIVAAKEVWPGDWDSFGGMLNGPNPPAPTAFPIRIVIGSKPQ